MSLTRLLRILTLAAVLFAPLSMVSGHGAMAMPNSKAATAMDHGQATAPAGHCADMDQDGSEPASPGVDCMIACSAVATADFAVSSHPAAHSGVRTSSLSALLSGLNPGSDPPPPRSL